MKSALNLILEPLHLSYVVKNEVLNITSEQLRDSEVYPVTYNVADLVMPIPNFVPEQQHGPDRRGQQRRRPTPEAGMVGGRVLRRRPVGRGQRQRQQHDRHDGSAYSGADCRHGRTDGRRRARRWATRSRADWAAARWPDFDSLIDLIVQTIQPDSWDANGGPGSITRFPNNLSLVISQKQDVHEEIADLLAQLRRLQDLQVTIEVRFITLNDNFFERIGVDFQVSLQDFAPAYARRTANVGTLNQGSALASYDPQL